LLPWIGGVSLVDINKLKQQLSKDNLALIVGGIFVLGLVFSAYTYFNKGGSVSDKIKNNAQKVEDIISSKTQRDNVANNTQNSNDQNAVLGSGAENTDSVWTANQYKPGDIVSGSYTVKRGDTLWQIAVAVYGDGTQWTRILTANSSNVGFLPDGSQALIITGQVLQIP
jgi:nucleoid-associated protein YgaU